MKTRTLAAATAALALALVGCGGGDDKPSPEARQYQREVQKSAREVKAVNDRIDEFNACTAAGRTDC